MEQLKHFPEKKIQQVEVSIDPLFSDICFCCMYDNTLNIT